MKKLILGDLSLQDIQEIAHVTERSFASYTWLDITDVELDLDIVRQVGDIRSRLINV